MTFKYGAPRLVSITPANGPTLVRTLTQPADGRGCDESAHSRRAARSSSSTARTSVRVPRPPSSWAAPRAPTWCGTAGWPAQHLCDLPCFVLYAGTRQQHDALRAAKGRRRKPRCYRYVRRRDQHTSRVRCACFTRLVHLTSMFACSERFRTTPLLCSPSRPSTAQPAAPVTCESRSTAPISAPTRRVGSGRC